MFREELLKRITVEKGMMGGKPCIRNMRFRVIDVIGHLASGMSIKELLEEHPALEEDDIYAALEYTTYILEDFKPLDTNETAPGMVNKKMIL